MAIVTFEGVVENGQIRLPDDVKLPEHARVYVVVPDMDARARVHVRSPRLANPHQAVDFVKEVIEGSADAGL